MIEKKFQDLSTGGYNELWFIQKYNEILASGKKYALVQINIKNFRYYNTKHGYQGGNEVLTLVYDSILDLLSEEEYAARIYADNFALLLKCEDTNALLYDRLIEKIDLFYRIEDPRVYRNLFLSYGICEIKEDMSFQKAWSDANLARKESASPNRRCHSLEIYDNKIHHQYMDRIELEVRTADAYKDYEFFPFYQPKVDAKTHKVVGAEALLRWYDEEGNLVPLYKYLPILNENSYIILVDLDIFDITCKLLEERLKKGLYVVPISFNLSKASFYEKTVIQDYIEIFEKYDIPKDLIQIELMETISLDDTDRMKYIISSFVDYGFKCILDDFGNGYSSFNVLLNNDISAVKIDRQFFLDNLNGDSKLIIKTVINLIKSLHMEVVAEGVETKEHADYLRECGCDMIQGFYFYKPISTDEFIKVLDNQ